MVQVTRKRAEELLHMDTFAPRELAHLLGTTEEHLFSEVYRGRLKAVRLGDDVVSFKRQDVLNWLAIREGATRAAR